MTVRSRACGFFITLEGGEGAGKTTQARRLKEYLESAGHAIVLTREPGGTPEAEKIRNLLVQGDGGNWTPIAETALFFAARAMHVETLIKPALAQGKIVICDRFTDSTRAYQGYGRGFSLEKIEDLDDLIVDKFEPDLTLIFDLPVEIGIDRSMYVKARADGLLASEDRFEKLEYQFHERMRQGFLTIAENNPHRCKVIDASQDEDNVFLSLKSVIDQRLENAV